MCQQCPRRNMFDAARTSRVASSGDTGHWVEGEAGCGRTRLSAGVGRTHVRFVETFKGPWELHGRFALTPGFPFHDLEELLLCDAKLIEHCPALEDISRQGPGPRIESLELRAGPAPGRLGNARGLATPLRPSHPLAMLGPLPEALQGSAISTQLRLPARLATRPPPRTAGHCPRRKRRPG